MAIADEAGEALPRGLRGGLLFDGAQGLGPGLRRDKGLRLQRLFHLKREQFVAGLLGLQGPDGPRRSRHQGAERLAVDRKSTRLNSSHQIISYAVFCLTKNKTTIS